MKRLALALALLLALAAPALAQYFPPIGKAKGIRIWVGRVNWSDYKPDAPLVVRQFYADPYTRVVYVADKITLVDGVELFIIENVRGQFCYYGRTCVWPVTQGRGVLIPVEVTIEPIPVPEEAKP